MAAITHILQAARRSRDLGERLLIGIRPEQFARRAWPIANQPIMTNHPAFIYGHLALYPAKILTVCGRAKAGSAAPSGYEAMFSRDAQCQDDPMGIIYPPMGEVAGVFLSTHDAMFPVLADLPDEALERPNPDARLAKVFTTVGFAATFLLCNHLAGHLGQVSAWRRCMGLGPA